MNDSQRSTRHTILLVLRAATAIALAWLGGLSAFGCYLALTWQLHPWPGGEASTLRACLYGPLMGVALVGPTLLWRVLLPRTRWWGGPVTMLFALATFATFTSNL